MTIELVTMLKLTFSIILLYKNIYQAYIERKKRRKKKRKDPSHRVFISSQDLTLGDFLRLGVRRLRPFTGMSSERRIWHITPPSGGLPGLEEGHLWLLLMVLRVGGR